MPATTDGLRFDAGKLPSPSPCPHCGAVRAVRTVEVAGRPLFAGFEPCGCPAAAEERARWEADRARAARFAEESAWERKLERAGIPPRYREASHPWAPKMAAMAMEGQGFYLHGGNGTGKTTLACAAALICLRKGLDMRFAVATKLLDELRDFGDAQRRQLAAMAKCDLLVVDDLGKEGAATPRAAEKLFDLFNDRYNNQTLVTPRPVVVTSNFPRGDVAARVSEGGAGMAVASRLKEMCRAVEMDGEDWRLNGQG